MNINVRSANDALEWINLFDNVNSMMGDFSEKNAYSSQLISTTSLIDTESNGQMIHHLDLQLDLET